MFHLGEKEAAGTAAFTPFLIHVVKVLGVENQYYPLCCLQNTVTWTKSLDRYGHSGKLRSEDSQDFDIWFHFS